MHNDGLQLDVDGGDSPVITAIGELDYQNCTRLGSLIQSVLDHRTVAVTLLLAGLEFVDSSGLRVLVKAADDARQSGGSIEIASMTHQLDRLLEISGFRNLFRLPQSVSEPEPVSPPYVPVVRSHVFDVPMVVASCREVREQVCTFASEMGFSLSELDDIRLAVGEAVSNAVRHGASGGTIHASCHEQGRLLTICLCYPSMFFDPETVPVPNMDPPPEGGMGIYFMRLLMDSVTYDFHEGFVTLTIAKSPRSAAIRETAVRTDD